MSAVLDREAWLAALGRARLGPNATRIGLALVKLASPDGTLAPGERAIAVEADCSRSSVWTYLRAMTQAGLVEVAGGALPGRPTCYRLVVPGAGR